MPYKCNICDKSFRYKVSQRSHKCVGPQSPQSEGNSDVANQAPETSAEIYSGANYSIKLMDTSVDIPNGDFKIVTINTRTENPEELTVNVDVVSNGSSTSKQFLFNTL